MRIGTWNLQRAQGREKNERRLSQIVAMDCDVWVLTETNDQLVPGPEYHPVSTSACEEAGARWVTIWSRLPIVKQVAVDDPHRTVAALVESPLGPLVVYGTVIPWHTDGAVPGNGVPNWAEQYRVLPLQSAEWARLVNEHPHTALCVAGDFNMNLGGKHFYGTHKGRALLREGLEAASLVCLTDDEHLPIGVLEHPPIDHICINEHAASAGWTVRAWPGKSGDGVKLSDHSGLVAEIHVPIGRFSWRAVQRMGRSGVRSRGNRDPDRD